MMVHEVILDMGNAVLSILDQPDAIHEVAASPPTQNQKTKR